MRDWPIGLSTGCFYRRSFFDIVDAVDAAGFARIEVCSFPAHLDYHDAEACRRAGRRLVELGIEACSFHAPFAAWIDITEPDDAVRGRSEAELLRAVEAAATVGARLLVIHPGPERSDLPQRERLHRMEHAVRVLDRVAGRCRELGVGLALENMLPHLFSGAVQDLLWLLGAMRATDVGICLDTGHAFLSGDLHRVVHKLSGHLWMVHASDNRGVFDDHLPPGEGAIPWSALLHQLEEARFGGPLILEIAGNGEVPAILERAARGRALLEQLEAGYIGARP